MIERQGDDDDAAKERLCRKGKKKRDKNPMSFRYVNERDVPLRS